MQPPFFSSLAFAWTFVGVLLTFLAIAAVIDTRTARVPKWLTVSLFVLGFVANAVRGGLLTAAHLPVWRFSLAESTVVGGTYGLTFALAGAVLAFACMFLFFALGQAGGGDVKLMTAIGAWIGPWNFAILLVLSAFVGALWAVGVVVVAGSSPRESAASRKSATKPQPFRLTFSASVAIALALLVMWSFRTELQLTTRPVPSGPTHAAPK
jgi:prepilin peptidase CpaA